MKDKDNKESDNPENKIYFSKYKPETKIGEGSFGKIFAGKQNNKINSN